MRENAEKRLEKQPNDPAALARLDALEAAYVPEPEAQTLLRDYAGRHRDSEKA
ncbi:MAG: hypothetical protein HWE12_00115 [Oceanospirillaceae bacterium]|nr:hypothetical protein [Oceanospirillaceae bacterium]